MFPETPFKKLILVDLDITLVGGSDSEEDRVVRILNSVIIELRNECFEFKGLWRKHYEVI